MRRIALLLLLGGVAAGLDSILYPGYSLAAPRPAVIGPPSRDKPIDTGLYVL
jgi:hypothetical protein